MNTQSLLHPGADNGFLMDHNPPIRQKDKFKKPPKKKFRLKLRFSQHTVKQEKLVKVERDHDFYSTKPIIPFKSESSYQMSEPPRIKKEPFSLRLKREEETWNPHVDDYADADPTYFPNSDDFHMASSDEDAAYFESEDVLQVKKVNTHTRKPKLKFKKPKRQPKVKKPRRRYKRRVLSDSEKLQASRRRRTCLVKKPKSQYLGVSWCNTKNTWVARVWHPTERKLIWAGYHQNERACALAVNEKCLDLQIPLKNPHIMGNNANSSEPSTANP